MSASVPEKVIVWRLQRFLRHKGMYLRVATSKRQKRWGLGRYYLLGTKGVIDKDIDIRKLAQHLKLLRSWESLSD
jgi:hypothetical protein